MNINNILNNVEIINKKGKTYFNLDNIKDSLITDFMSVRKKMLLMGLDVSRLIHPYIDTYTFMIIILLSNDESIYKYKYFFVYASISLLNELINPDIAIDKAKSIFYKQGIDLEYSYKKKNKLFTNNGKNNYLKNMINEEIKNSLDIDTIRQLF